MSPGRIDGLRAFITGAGSGIGWAVARGMLEEGAQIYATSIEAPGLDERFEELETMGANTAILDVTEPTRIEETVEDAVDRLGGPIDILSNNAGIELSHAPSVAETTEQEWDRVLQVNLKGAFLVCRAVIPLMANGGAIINMGSTKSFVGRINAAAYVASKSGLLGFTRALALELAPRRIRVNCVCPGTIETPLTREFIALSEDPDELTGSYAAKSPLNRIGTPEEVADCVVFLASAEASFVTGTSLLVDGGALAW